MNLGAYYPARFDPPFWPPVIALIVPTEKSDLSSGDVDEAMHNCGELFYESRRIVL